MLPILSGLLSPFGTAIPFEPFEFSRPLIDDARVMSVVSAPDAAAATAVVAASVPPTPVTAVDANVAVKLGGIPLHRLPETFRFQSNLQILNPNIKVWCFSSKWSVWSLYH